MPRRTSLQGGFTLIELIAVVAVVATLSIVAAPLWRTPGGADAAVNRILHDLQTARTLALARGTSLSLPITGAASYTDPYGATADLAPWKVTLVANGVIGFNGRGEPTDATEIVVTGSDGSRNITLSPTGLAAP